MVHTPRGEKASILSSVRKAFCYIRIWRKTRTACVFSCRLRLSPAVPFWPRTGDARRLVAGRRHPGPWKHRHRRRRQPDEAGAGRQVSSSNFSRTPRDDGLPNKLTSPRRNWFRAHLQRDNPARPRTTTTSPDQVGQRERAPGPHRQRLGW